MTADFIPATDLHVLDGQSFETLPDGRRRAHPGNHGFVFYGPYRSAEAGVYRVKARAGVEAPHGAQSYFDVYADGRILASRLYRDGCEVHVLVEQTAGLEFRFRSEGEGFLVEGVELEPLLIEREAADPDRLRGLADRLLGADAQPAAIFHLIDRLLAQGDRETARRTEVAFLQRGEAAGSEALRLFFEVNAPDFARSRAEAAPGEAVTREALAAELGGLPLQVVDLHVLEPDHRAALLAHGYRADFLEATRLHRYPGEPRRPWQPAPGPEAAGASRSENYRRLDRLDLSHHAELAREGGLTAFCPITGRRLRSRHGFCQSHLGMAFLFYRFEGPEVFYVCTGGAIDQKTFIYMPRTGVLVLISDPLQRGYSNEDVIRLFNVNLVDMREEVRSYLGRETRPAGVFSNNNLGHYLWNDLGGLHHATVSGFASELIELVELPGQFPVKPGSVFPELSRTPTTVFHEAAPAFLHCLQNGLLPIRFADAIISDRHAALVLDAAAAHATAAGAPPADAPRPLIWINLRAHRKIWVGQAEGYANILNALYEEYGSASGFIDGWSDCAAIAQEIRERVRPEIPLYDGLNLGLHDSLNWSRAVDSYVCTIGSGLVMLTWFAGKHGVAHSERAHLGQMDWWGEVRVSAPPPLSIPHAQVTDIGEGGFYCDYDVDWRVLLEMLRQALRAAGATPSPLSDASAVGGAR